MTGLRRYNWIRDLINDDLARFELPSVTTRMYLYDPEQYDLVPKKDYVEKQIKEKDAEIARMDERLAKLKEERDLLLKQKIT